MFSIGEFSRVSGLTIKTLRFYHEEGLLPPARIDPQSGYRYYDESQIELARTIGFLRELEIPLAEIKTLLESKRGDEEILDLLERQRTAIQQQLVRYKKIAKRLDRFIADERRGGLVAGTASDVVTKSLLTWLIASVRMTGRYAECGKVFGRIARACGRHIGGSPFLLHYEAEYKEADADFEVCIPVRRKLQAEGISCRELSGGECVAVLHKGPYDQLGKSYAKILRHVSERGYRIVMPTREVYLKGPGMIFQGNPQHYLTEIQIPIERYGTAE
jgi:DNA-binding transcriptional MerR regulator/effector-binding domain-containing protein